MITNTTVFNPVNKKIYIWNNNDYVDSASSNNVILVGKFYVALQLVDNNISIAFLLYRFIGISIKWYLIYTEDTLDAILISDILRIRCWDIALGDR